jgi:hypothetical protein
MRCSVGLDFLPVAGQKKMTIAAPGILKRERLHATPTRLAGTPCRAGSNVSNAFRLSRHPNVTQSLEAEEIP